MGSAGYQLSQVAELVETILCDVEPVDVLLWQRVCKVWRGTVTGSLKLQRLLFFRPEEGPPENPTDEEHPSHSLEGHDIESRGIDAVRHNDLLDKLLADLALGRVYLNENRKVVPACKGRAPASWRRMFLTQPPAKRIELAVLFEYSDSFIIGDDSGEIIWAKSHFTEVLEDPEGVRAGEIVKRMIKRQDQMEARRTICAEVLSGRPEGDEEMA
ncbi:hypothetical protein LTR36_010836 [Oleoguttula mirabilis]|uniref:F-box domain-containing protein n=1 Tax=Oleoguttula mirabilis TaxID=1507867 RepID=A0AAV9J4K0_9PEZI|nr:hypothetical protein LTR36_010836 [Oleoguttula mirabilis]